MAAGTDDNGDRCPSRASLREEHAAIYTMRQRWTPIVGALVGWDTGKRLTDRKRAPITLEDGRGRDFYFR